MDNAEGTAMDEIDRKPHFKDRFRSAPVFLIGQRRSGTTLLSWFLDSHPGISVVPENPLCRSFLSSSFNEGVQATAAAPLVLAAAAVESLGQDVPAFNARIADVINTVYLDYAARAGKARWVCKEPFVADCVDLLDSLFDYQARFIYVVRHGLDSAFSAATTFGHFGRATASGLLLTSYLQDWCAGNHKLMDFLARNRARCHQVRYEDFVCAPQEAGQAIVEFLEEPWASSILSDMWKSPHHPRLGRNSPQVMGNAIDRTRMRRWAEWPVELIRQLAAIANPTLVRLGYEPVRSG